MALPGLSLSIAKIGPESDAVLRNLYEHYIHDMSERLEIETKADGSYSYDTSVLWANGYDVYLAKVGNAIAGFALAGPASEWLGDVGAYDAHEFFVMRRYLRRGAGKRMAALLWKEHPGEWLVRVLESNSPAVPFWRAAISSYSPSSYVEESRMVNGHRWLYFTCG